MEDSKALQTDVIAAPLHPIVMASVPVRPYYSDEHCVIYHADCRKVLPWLERVDLLLTDPPYGENYSSSREGRYKGKTIANDDSTEVRDWVLNWRGYDLPSLVFGTWRTPVLAAKQALVWDKGDASGMGDLSIPWKPNWELVFVIGKGFRGKRDSSVLTGHTVVTWASKGRMHPNLKPLSLMRVLLNKCPDAETVLDPFMGSGTTLVAAKLEGRKAIGIEINEKYCESAAERLRQGVLF